MNNMLDIVYLQKRIDFLEKALSTVLKEHQINGLHLLRGKNRKEVDENHNRHSFRDRLIYFLAKRKNLLDDGTSNSEKKSFKEENMKEKRKI